RLYQLLLNLVSNALKFRRPGQPCQVRVSVQQRAGTTTWSVADDGIGIDAADRELIFAPFQRVHSPSEYEGTGLGLAICRHIVEQHGGTLWVESELGRGSTFSFTLPGVAAKRS
ncbi:MAG TPA: ATP-binding protein, partial [Polyangiales bacterium]|nr:ATP-binding protein [Polyangiales bacterium]